jgi:pyruvate/2-oxoglutarate dehydrogenase complex dihydrolipoamide acyltransferase (E2) component
VRVTHREAYDTAFKLTPQHEVLVANGDEVTEGQLLARLGEGEDLVEIKAPAAGRRHEAGSTLTLHSEESTAASTRSRTRPPCAWPTATSSGR